MESRIDTNILALLAAETRGQDWRDAYPKPKEVQLASSRLLSVAAVAALLDRTQPTIRAYIAQGELPGIRIGGTYKIPEAGLDDLVRRRLVNPNKKSKRDLAC